MNLHGLEIQQNPFAFNVRKLWKNKFSNRATLKEKVDTNPEYGNRADLLRAKPSLRKLFFFFLFCFSYGGRGDALGPLVLVTMHYHHRYSCALREDDCSYRSRTDPCFVSTLQIFELYEMCCIPYTIKLEAIVRCTYRI
jgi:hypothetical protein